MPEQFPETAAEALNMWDKGEPVWSVDMGGMGPGYEQAIQVLAFEIIRDNVNTPLPPAGDKAWRTWGDAAAHRLSKWGFSGAQVGAAKNIASITLKKGWRVALNEMKAKDPDRLILVSDSLQMKERTDGDA